MDIYFQHCSRSLLGIQSLGPGALEGKNNHDFLLWSTAMKADKPRALLKKLPAIPVHLIVFIIISWLLNHTDGLGVPCGMLGTEPRSAAYKAKVRPAVLWLRPLKDGSESCSHSPKPTTLNRYQQTSLKSLRSLKGRLYGRQNSKISL